MHQKTNIRTASVRISTNGQSVKENNPYDFAGAIYML